MDELIKALRRCGTGGSLTERCWTCDYYDREPWCEAALVNDAAAALEAADKRIAELEDDLRNSTISNDVPIVIAAERKDDGTTAD